MQDTRMQDTRMQDTRMQDTRMQDTRMQDTRMQDTRMQGHVCKTVQCTFKNSNALRTHRIEATIARALKLQ